MAKTSDSKKNRRHFLKTFFKERKQVGAVAPSSRFLIKKMCDKIEWEDAKVIVEFGPGTGVFTAEILERAPQDATIFIFELNEAFYDMLSNKFNDQRIVLLHRSADELGEVLAEHGINEVDAIISSLPLAVIPKEICRKIIANASVFLRKGGKYVQYQYSLNSKKMIEEAFDELKLSFVTINIPPAFIYTATNKEGENWKD